MAHGMLDTITIPLDRGFKIFTSVQPTHEKTIRKTHLSAGKQ